MKKCCLQLLGFTVKPKSSSSADRRSGDIRFALRKTNHASRRGAAAVFVVLFLVFTGYAFADEQGDDNPTGVSGVFNGTVETAGSYDPYTGSARRVVDDIVVPGSVGAYPLKWTRTFNSHCTYDDSSTGGAWRYPSDYSYDATRNMVKKPDGAALNFKTYTDNGYAGIPGVPEIMGNGSPYQGAALLLADGGKVVFGSNVTTLVDPYGQPTTIVTTGTDVAKTTTITAPGGRYLIAHYGDTNTNGGNISKVEAFDGISGDPAIDTVTYTWTAPTSSITHWTLTTVTYADGTQAHYTYADKNYPAPPICNPPIDGHWTATVLNTCDDLRFAGPMRQIAYQYDDNGHNHTRIIAEKNLVTGEVVSSIAGIKGSGTSSSTETRGDNASRIFNFYSVPRQMDCAPGEPPVPGPTDGKLSSFTDFFGTGHTTTLGYDTNTANFSTGFVTSVIDPNNHETHYTYQTGSWGITRITHVADGSHIDQTFWPSNSQTSPYFLASRTDELGHTTSYIRDTNNRITEKDYPHDADEPPSSETFAYNGIDEVTDHKLTSNGTEHFAYDSRGVKTSWTDASGGITDYTYYTASDYNGVWTDRVQSVTHPVNASGFREIETYQYDRAFDGGGENSGFTTTQTPVTGRGLVTRIVHPDGTYQSFGYDRYGYKLWQEDELRHRASYTYDDYGRVLTITTPPRQSGEAGNTTTNSYVPWSPVGVSSYITTGHLPFVTTLPSGKKTNFYYDVDWRKTRVQQAPGMGVDEANTYYYYDMYGTRMSIGNLLATTDPKNYTTQYHYDIRDRQDQITDALGTALGDPNHTTSFTFDYHGNKKTETHAVTVHGAELTDYDVYSAMNRLRHKRVHRDDSTIPPTIDQTSMTYDSAGNLASHMDENSHSFTYSYDPMNRITSMIYPDTTKHEDTSYDAAGNKKTYTNRTGIIQHFDRANSYDNRNRLTYFDWSDGTTSPQTTVYDIASRKTQITNSDATVNFAYYDDNLVKIQEGWVTAPAVVDSNHRLVSYHYDADGNRDWITYPSGTKFNYSYTQRNQMQAITLDGTQTPIVSYGFDGNGNITSRSLDNQTSTAYSVDAVNRETFLVHTLAGTTRQFGYAYNNVNDILAVQRDVSRGDGYDYDLTQQITKFHQNGIVNLSDGSVTNPTTDNNMSFDGCGNRLSLNGANDTFNVMNQSVNVGHDNEGNVQSYNGWIYTYDAHNRLRVANNPTIPSTTNFYYDGLNRQVARSTNGPAPSPTATPPPTPTPTPTATPTPTPTPPPNQCAPVTFSTTGRYPNTMKVTLSTTTSGATIFYTVKNIGTNVPPTHSGGTATGGTLIYSSPVNVVAGADKIFQAVAYKAGMTDSVITQFEADNTNPGGFAIIRGGVVSPMSPTLVTTTIYSVWDGDWALLEEYAPGNILTQKYVQGYHGLVKTLVDNIHYYQDSLGSTSHIADGNGNLLEWYKYNLYGAPTYWDASNTQTMTGSNYGVRDLFGGGRLVTEIGLYDNRNRFMSCDLGRFLQPDPIGFKGDGSNLYRYCNNNWGNKTDPLGTDALIVFEGYGTLTFHGGTKDTVGNVTLRNYAAAHGGVSIPRGNQGKALEIMASERAKDPTAFITTIGYSRGAIAANQTDREAGRRGITVNRQITIDPVTIEGGQAQLRVPPNVEEAENYHEHSSSWPPFQGGTLLNPNEHNHDYDLSGPGIDHNTIVKHALARSEAISMRTFGMLNLNGARGGGTAWGEQSNGSFVDSQGSSINLASDVDPAVEGAAARVPFSSW